jgi:putative PIN family toxin of toxin-antitoxin system
MAVDRAQREGAILLSYAVLAEIFEVLHREKFSRYIDEEDIRRFLAAVTREAEWVDIDVEVTACRDPKDDKFLDVAVHGSADAIVTGDQDLLDLNPFRGIAILTPREYLDRT